jgi:hypothetical protein
MQEIIIYYSGSTWLISLFFWDKVLTWELYKVLSFFFPLIFFFFLRQSYYVAQAGFKLSILPFLPHECCDYRQMCAVPGSPCWAFEKAGPSFVKPLPVLQCASRFGPLAGGFWVSLSLAVACMGSSYVEWALSSLGEDGCGTPFCRGAILEPLWSWGSPDLAHLNYRWRSWEAEVWLPVHKWRGWT